MTRYMNQNNTPMVSLHATGMVLESLCAIPPFDRRVLAEKPGIIGRSLDTETRWGFARGFSSYPSQ